jgi:DNA repair exonuclease SbcCD nuclease subunit
VINNKYAIFSDLHLGVHQNSSTWHKIAKDWSDWFISDLKSKKIDKILFLGDYFHSRSDISVNTLHIASDITHKFKDFQLIMLVGNHCSFLKDKADIHSLSIFKGYSNIEIVDKPKMFKFGDKNVFFCPWGTEYDDIQKCDALMGHFEIQTFKMNTYKLCEHGFTGKMLGKKAPLIFSGHFHLRDERDYGSYKINYVGNPFEMDFGDTESSKGYYIIDFDSMKYEFFENKISPKHKKIKLSQFDDSKNIIGNNIVKIIVDTNIENDELEKYSTNIQQLNPISLSFDNTTAFNPILEELDEEYDLSGVDMEKAITDFVNLLDIDDKDSVSNYTLNLFKNV